MWRTWKVLRKSCSRTSSKGRSPPSSPIPALFMTSCGAGVGARVHYVWLHTRVQTHRHGCGVELGQVLAGAAAHRTAALGCMGSAWLPALLLRMPGRAHVPQLLPSAKRRPAAAQQPPPSHHSRRCAAAAAPAGGRTPRCWLLSSRPNASAAAGRRWQLRAPRALHWQWGSWQPQRQCRPWLVAPAPGRGRCPGRPR